MKGGKKLRRLLIPCAALFALIGFAQGYLYYGQQALPSWSVVLLSINNAVKCFLFSSDLSPKEVAATLAQQQEAWRYLLGCAYVAITLLAPLCTATALFQSLRRLLALRGLLGGRGGRLVIFGCGEHTLTLLRTLEKRGPAPLVIARGKPEEALSLACARLGARVVSRTGGELRESWLRSARRILLLEREAPDNLNTYLQLESFLAARRRAGTPPIPCHMYCGDPWVSQLTGDYLAGRSQAPHLLLSLFDWEELKARQVLSAYPLWMAACRPETGLTPAAGCHLLLLGLGRLGTAVLIQAIQQGVFSSGGEVVVDIVDRNAEEKLEIFARRFSQDAAQVSPREVVLPRAPQGMDGRLVLRAHTMDASTYRFQALAAELHRTQPVTYAAVCFRDPALTAASLFTLSRVFAREEGGPPVPILSRLMMPDTLAGYLEQDQTQYQGVHPFPADEAVIRLDNILSAAAEQEGRAYHQAYNQWSGRLSGQGGPAVPWESLSVFKRSSNTASALYAPTRLLQAGSLMSAALGGPLSRWYDGGALTGQAREALSALLAPQGRLLPPEELLLLLKQSPWLEELAKTEHRRWCQFMLLNGYSTGPAGEPAGRRLAARHNPNLVSWEELLRRSPLVAVYDLIPLLLRLEPSA